MLILTSKFIKLLCSGQRRIDADISKTCKITADINDELNDVDRYILSVLFDIGFNNNIFTPYSIPLKDLYKRVHLIEGRFSGRSEQKERFKAELKKLSSVTISGNYTETIDESVITDILNFYIIDIDIDGDVVFVNSLLFMMLEEFKQVQYYKATPAHFKWAKMTENTIKISMKIIDRLKQGERDNNRPYIYIARKHFNKSEQRQKQLIYNLCSSAYPLKVEKKINKNKLKGVLIWK